MKPKVLTRIEDREFSYPDWMADASRHDEGVIDSMGCGPEDFDFPVMEAALVDHGYARRKCYGYANISLTYLNGSAKWHTDPGFGLVAGLLVHDSWDASLTGPCELITRHGPTELRVGDLFIFNADKGHAWISNQMCIIAMMTIKPQRKP